jgi:hypothetical protein
METSLRTASRPYSFLDVPFDVVRSIVKSSVFTIRDHIYLKFHVVGVLNVLLFGS